VDVAACRARSRPGTAGTPSACSPRRAPGRRGHPHSCARQQLRRAAAPLTRVWVEHARLGGRCDDAVRDERGRPRRDGRQCVEAVGKVVRSDVDRPVQQPAQGPAAAGERGAQAIPPLLLMLRPCCCRCCRCCRCCSRSRPLGCSSWLQLAGRAAGSAARGPRCWPGSRLHTGQRRWACAAPRQPWLGQQLRRRTWRRPSCRGGRAAGSWRLAAGGRWLSSSARRGGSLCRRSCDCWQGGVQEGRGEGGRGREGCWEWGWGPRERGAGLAAAPAAGARGSCVPRWRGCRARLRLPALLGLLLAQGRVGEAVADAGHLRRVVPPGQQARSSPSLLPPSRPTRARPPPETKSGPTSASPGLSPRSRRDTASARASRWE
jgi:hypothetical protein